MNTIKDLAKVIVEVKKDLHQLDELLIGETSLFRSTTWKVIKSAFLLLQVLSTKVSLVLIYIIIYHSHSKDR